MLPLLRIRCETDACCLLIAASNRCPDGETVPEDQDNIQVRVRLPESPRAAEAVGIMGANLGGSPRTELLIASRAASGKQ